MGVYIFLFFINICFYIYTHSYIYIYVFLHNICLIDILYIYKKCMPFCLFVDDQISFVGPNLSGKSCMYIIHNIIQYMFNRYFVYLQKMHAILLVC